MEQLDYILTRYRTTRQTSVRMTAEMKSKVEEAAKERYGVRGLARWVEESLASFTSHPNAVLRVGAGEDGVDFPALKIFRLTAVSDDYLRDMAGKILRMDPLVHNAKSQILRAAFRHAIKAHEKHLASSRLTGTGKATGEDQALRLRLEDQPRIASSRKAATAPTDDDKAASNG